MKMRRRQQIGFTLIELMVTIAILAIILSLAAPAVQTFVSRSTMRGISSDFTLGMQRARSEAINRNECVVICMSDNGQTCYDTGSSWGVGWIAYHNPTCGTATTSTPSDSSTIFLVRERFSDRYQLNSTTETPIGAVTFGPRGETATSTNGCFNLIDTQAPPSEGNINRTFCLNRTGRIRTLDYSP
jgi:type IV fimbrial biogenesis protein FimT